MKTRSSLLVILAFLTLNFSFLPAAGPGEFEGHWDGLADGQVVFSLDVRLDGTDLIGVINAPDQGLNMLETEWSKFSGDHEVMFSFEMPENGSLVLAGKLDDEGKFVGTYAFGEQMGNFIMTKKVEEEEEG